MAEDETSQANPLHLSEQVYSRPFQCTWCKRSFSRLEHLKRHNRIHTREEPYMCSTCGRQFSRADRLKKHGCSGTDSNDHASHTPLLNRVSRACNTCAISKLKCSEKKPCERCSRKNIVCQFNTSRAFANPKWQAREPSRRQEIERWGDDVNDSPDLTPDLTQQPFQHTENNTSDQNGSSISRIEVPPSLESASFDNDRDLSAWPSNSIQSSNISQLDLIDGLFKELASGPIGHQTTPTPFLDLWDTLMDPSLSMGHTDFSGELCSPESLPGADRTQKTGEMNIVSGVETFDAAFWTWTPTSADSEASNQDDIHLSADVSRRVLPFNRPGFLGPKAPCQTADRERVLELLVATNSSSSTFKLVSCFPSVHMMTNLVHAFLLHHTSSKLSYIHGPTFSSEDAPEQLLTVMIAYGACLMPFRTAQKLGYAILEFVKTNIVKEWELDNRRSRDLALLQAYSLHLSLSLWSGDKRRTELAEGLQQPVIIILRRSGWLRADYYSTVVPYADDNEDTLESKWHQWVVQESKKRLAHHIFMHDMQMSMLTSNPPAMSPSEMRLPLPELEDLWLAPSALEWRKRFHEQARTNPTPNEATSISEVVKQVLTGSSLPLSYAQTPETQLLLLHGLWRYIWEYQNDFDFLAGDDTPEELSFLPLHTRRSLLVETLRQLFNGQVSHRNYVGDHSIDEEVAILYHFESLCVHSSFHGLQAFAGRFGDQEAHQSVPKLRKWSLTQNARIGLWHAAQILHVSKSLPSAKLRDFNAFALYSAAVTLFGFSALKVTRQSKLVHQVGSPSQSIDSMINHDDVVWLCSDGMPRVQDFISFNTFQPGIKGFDTPPSASLLSQPPQVLDIFIHSFFRAWDQGDEKIPPLFVEALVEILSGVAVAARAAGFK